MTFRLLLSLLIASLLCSIEATQSLLELIDSKPEFSTISSLLSLLPEIELELFLYQTGPYTFFLPRNEGMQSLKQFNYLARLFIPSYRMHLYSLIHYQITDYDLQEHVLESIKKHNTNRTTTKVDMEMLTSEPVGVDSSDGSSIILTSPLSSAQIVNTQPINTTDNAIVYETSSILLPQWMKWNLMSVMEHYDWEEVSHQSGPMYTRFIKLLVAGGIDDTLRDGVFMTLLAPTNGALADGVMNLLLDPGSEEALEQFLRYHILPQIFNIHSLEYESTENVMTKLGEWMVVKSTNQGMFFNHAPLKGMQLTRHGVLYRVGAALIPPSWR